MDGQLTHQIEHNMAVISLAEDLAIENVKPTIDQVKKITMNPHIVGIVLDCKQMRGLDASGLSTIVGLYRVSQEHHKSFTLSGLTEKNLKLLTLLQWNIVLQVCENETIAMISSSS